MASYYLCLTFLVVTFIFNLINAQPSPGFYPSSQIGSKSFYQGYRTLWGAQHQKLQGDTLTIWLDRYTGSGFKSLQPYTSGYFSASMKLQPGYTAGVITSFYLSNQEDYPGHHDEIDIEFLGTTPGKPYTLQTNIYNRGTGDGRLIGREIKFHLWFDPTQAFHNYAIFWSPTEIIFFVDDVPIRRYPKKSDSTFPNRPMWAYGSIWDASSWATEDGKYKADYNYSPFVGSYKNFKISGCTSSQGGDGYGSCLPRVSPSSLSGLSSQQMAALQWAQSNSMVYDYCRDSKRDHTLTPEC